MQLIKTLRFPALSEFKWRLAASIGTFRVSAAPFTEGTQIPGDLFSRKSVSVRLT
jgi:hypothetical protein